MHLGQTCSVLRPAAAVCPAALVATSTLPCCFLPVCFSYVYCLRLILCCCTAHFFGVTAACAVMLSCMQRRCGAPSALLLSCWTMTGHGSTTAQVRELGLGISSFEFCKDMGSLAQRWDGDSGWGTVGRPDILGEGFTQGANGEGTT